MNEKEVVAALAALAQPSRLRIFRQLVEVGQAGLTPGSLGERLDIPPATLSFHLKELLNAGLLEQTREGRSLIYSTRIKHMAGLIDYLTENCCQGEPCLVVAATCKC
jgi:DNA-binding transcriptional ArsR family regulator